MTRERLKEYIAEQYGVAGERLWAKYPGYEVFRHTGNKKWFAIIMDVTDDKLGIIRPFGAEPKALDILDVKCDAVFAGSLSEEGGIYPAYHMNKSKWISLDIAQVDEEKIKLLLDISYNLTSAKAGRRKD